MSERKIRLKADHPWSCASHKVSHIEKRRGVEEEIHYRCDCGLVEALSADPDLVVLLRFVSGLWADSWGESERQAALEEVIDHINKTVRLTDEPPGYEWVEGEGDATRERD